jgi:AcrR family transcriptional regulator
VFVEDGVDAASMQRITERSGVSKATVYNHFPGKDQLFEVVMLEQLRKLRDNSFTLRSGLDKLEDVLFGLGVGLVSGILQPQKPQDRAAAGLRRLAFPSPGPRVHHRRSQPRCGAAVQLPAGPVC